jgi:hypothetical protein
MDQEKSENASFGHGGVYGRSSKDLWFSEIMAGHRQIFFLVIEVFRVYLGANKAGGSGDTGS